MRMMLFFMLLSHIAVAQQKFGIELRAGLFHNDNLADFENYTDGETLGEIKNEVYESSLNYAIGFSYSISDKHQLKLLFGRQSDANIKYEGEEFVTNGGTYQFSSEVPYQCIYTFISYSYDFKLKYFEIPLELGLGLNKNKQTYYYNGDLNSQILLSTGIQYPISESLFTGIRLSFISSLESHVREEYYLESGDIIFYKLGLELNAGYYF